MDTIEILRTVSKLVYENVKDLAGTKWRYFKKY